MIRCLDFATFSTLLFDIYFHIIVKLTQEYETQIAELRSEISMLSTSNLSAKKSPGKHQRRDSENHELDFTIKILKGEIDDLKVKLLHVKKEKESNQKKFTMEFNALMSKYEQDVNYYKQIIKTHKENDGSDEEIEQFSASSPKSNRNQDIILNELQRNEEIYIQNEGEKSCLIIKFKIITY